MSEFIRTAAESLPPYRQELVARCFEFVEMTRNRPVNEYIDTQRNAFIKKLKSTFPDLRTKEIPEIQALIGGGETDTDTHAPEMLKEILAEIDTFLIQSLPGKEALVRQTA